MTEDWMVWLGIKVPDLVAGFAGGVVNAIAFKRSDFVSISGSVIVGAFTANYLGEIVTRQFGTSPAVGAFLVGLGGMALVQGLISAMKNWRPGVLNGGSDGNK